MANIVPLPAELQKIIGSFNMLSAEEVALRRLQVFNEIHVIRTLVLDGEYVPVRDLVEFIGMWSWRPILRRS